MFGALFDGLYSKDPVVRLRVADALEKITVEHPEWLKPYKKRVLKIASITDQPEVRWHLAQMLPRLTLTLTEQSEVMRVFRRYLDDASSIVRTFTLQALAELSDRDRGIRKAVVVLLRKAVRSGTPAMKSRARKLLERLGEAQLRTHKEMGAHLALCMPALYLISGT
jgi:HEAT repeat protein